MPTRAYFTRIADDARPASPCALAIGNFDGVHRGHREVLSEAIVAARAASLPMAVLTFDPHPALALGRPAPPTLTSLPRKAELLARLGIDHVFVKNFDDAFAGWSPERFVEELIEARLAARIVMVGENFRFGHKRAGDLAALETLGTKYAFAVKRFALSGDERGRYSSTRVRDALVRGELADANHVLGRWHAFSGTVARGAQRGRTIGFPTANVEDVAELVPHRGVYAVVVDMLDAERTNARALGRGVMNVGVRPTVADGSERRSQEVYLLDFDGDLYGAHVRVHVVERIREERKFASLDELRAQIATDAERARGITASIEPQNTDVFRGAFG